MPHFRQAQDGPCAVEMPEHAIELSWRFLDALTAGDGGGGVESAPLPQRADRLDPGKVREAQADCRAARALRAVLLSVIKANPAAGRSDQDRLTLVMLALAGDVG